MIVVPPAGAVALTGGLVGVATAEGVAVGTGRTACVVGTEYPCEACVACDACEAADVGEGEGTGVGVGEESEFKSGSESGSSGSVKSCFEFIA